jgi:hypothetical protein
MPVDRQLTATCNFTVYLMCLFAIYTNVASVRQWLKQGCEVSYNLPEHYSTSADLRTGTLLYIKQFPTLPHRNLATRPNTDWRMVEECVHSNMNVISTS